MLLSFTNNQLQSNVKDIVNVLLSGILPDHPLLLSVLVQFHHINKMVEFYIAKHNGAFIILKDNENSFYDNLYDALKFAVPESYDENFYNIVNFVKHLEEIRMIEHYRIGDIILLSEKKHVHCEDIEYKIIKDDKFIYRKVCKNNHDLQEVAAMMIATVKNM